MNIDHIKTDDREKSLQGNAHHKRQKKLAEGTLQLTEKINFRMKLLLKVHALCGEVKITTNATTTEHLPIEEKPHFHDIADLTNWPVNGVIEVWTQTENPHEYTVVEYQKIK